MELPEVLEALAALSQETRLRAFRILIKHGKKGIASGDLSKKLRTPANTLSFHLAHLRRSGLVTARKEGRCVIYRAHIKAMQELVEFLLEDCCAVDKSDCAGIEKLIKKATKKRGCC